MEKLNHKETLAKIKELRNRPALGRDKAEIRIEQKAAIDCSVASDEHLDGQEIPQIMPRIHELTSEVQSESKSTVKSESDLKKYFRERKESKTRNALAAVIKNLQQVVGDDESPECNSYEDILANLIEPEPEEDPVTDFTIKPVMTGVQEFVKTQTLRDEKNVLPSTNADGHENDQTLWQEEIKKCSVMPYPVHAFGKWADLITLISTAIQVAPEMVGSSILSLLAALAQPHINVTFKATGKGGPTSLNMLIIAASGERKSSTMEALAAPFYRAIRRALDERRTMIVQDVTVDGLAVALINRCPAIFLLAVEAASLLGGHAMSKDNLSRFLGNVSALFSGEAITRTRVEEHHYAEDRRLSVLMFAQPIVAMEFLSSELIMQQGLANRFSICQPQSLLGTRKHIDIELELEPVYLKYCEEITAMADQAWEIDPETGGVHTRTVRMSPEAKARWVEVSDTLEEAAGPGGAMATHAGYVTRFPEQIMRMAALLAMIDNHQVQVIEETYMLRAIDLGNYYLDSALNIFSSAPANKDEMDAGTLLDWMRHKITELDIAAIPVRMMYKDGPRCARTSKRTKELLSILEGRGEIVEYKKAVLYGDGKRSGDNYAVVTS